LLMGVVPLVSEAARGEVPGKSLRIDVAQLLSDRSNCLIPGNSTESFVAFVANHRYSQASEFPQRFFCLAAQGSDIFKHAPVHRRHGVEAQKLQANGAEVDALHSPVVHAARAKRAAITASVAQNAPSVAEIVPVVPHGAQNVFVSVGMLLMNSVGNQADPVAFRLRMSRFRHGNTLLNESDCMTTRRDGPQG